MSSSMTNSILVSSIQQVTSKSRFPRLQECAHFHYEVSTVDLPKDFKCILDNQEPGSPNELPASNNESTSSWFKLQVTSNEKKWIIYRTFENFRYLDKHLHECIFDRKFTLLEDLSSTQTSSPTNDMTSSTMSTLSSKKSASYKSQNSVEQIKQNKNTIIVYLSRFCEIAFVNPLNCGPILNWFELDNKGHRLCATDDSPINIPGVAAAVVLKRYVAQNLDEISLDVGNMISVIDMPPPDESIWWRGKKELEVGFFPADCVELIKSNQHLSSNVTEHLPKLNQNQSVRLKHGKLITILRSFFNTRPARNQLQLKGILKQRVFACDLGEHLSNSQEKVPKILTICTEFIEKYGIQDGIYRHTGLQSNIQKLRNAFDEEKFSEIEQEAYINDIHSVGSLLKMYFRELPNPLLTYQLYHKFIRAVNVEDKIIEIHDVVQQLPPPHYRTLAFLMKHLHKLAEYSPSTNMNTKNLAIVWAPNLLKSKEMDSKDCMQYDMLHSITLQANISEFLIANADTIFNDKFASLVRKPDGSMKGSSMNKNYRPISVCYNASAKLLTLDEAQDKYKQVGPPDIPKYHTVIEMPDLSKKKKSKEKDKDKEKNKDKEKASLTVSNPIPANIHIQQQFELLQQQQQQQQPQQMTSSVSSQSISSPVISANHNNNNNCNNQTSNNSGSSSPAFKSILRSLRVGSIKHQPSNVSTASTLTTSTINPASQILNDSNESSKPIINTSGIVRTASTSTFKPPASSTLGITSAQTNQSANISSQELKHEYSNCLSQLQSAAAQAINSTHHVNNIALYTGTLSTPNACQTNNLNSQQNTNPSIFLKNNKLNQSQTSIHSNIVQQNSTNSANQPILSTFKDINSPTTSDLRRNETKNPIPSVRRTIQPNTPTSNNHQVPSSNSSSSIHMSTFNRTPVSNSSQKQQAPAIPVNQKSTHYTEENEYDEVDPNTLLSNKEPDQLSNTFKRNVQANEDEMRKIVEYINQFEQNSILQQSVSLSPQPDQPDLIESDQNSQEDKQNGTLIQSMIVDEPSKLRLSSSSLSSSADSFLNEPVPNQPSLETSNSISQIDRRTYIINKIYDNLNHNENFEDEQEDLNEDQYEKVILNSHKETKEEPIYESEYDNDLLVSNENENENIIIVNRANMPTKPSQEEHIYVNVNEFRDEFEPEEQNPIRESLGFDVAPIISEKNHYENAPEIPENNIEGENEENFDSQLVELNNQIKKLLSANEDEENEEGKKQEEEEEKVEIKVSCEIIVEEKPVTKRPKSAGVDQNVSQEQVKRRITVSGSSYPSPTVIQRTKNSKNITEPTNHICKSASNDEIVTSSHQQPKLRSSFRLKQNTENLVESNSNQKRKSSMNLDELKRIRSIENEQHIPQIENFSESLKIVPKTRQSIQHQESKSQEQYLNKKNNLSKSLQDNSKLDGQTTKLVIIDTSPVSSGNEENLNESISVKSKIKLMESIVGSSSTKESSKIPKGERSSSSSSSCSSSRSPPLSPKVNLTEIRTPLSVNKPIAPLVPARTNVNTKTVTNTQTDQSESPSPKDEQKPLCNLREKRKTVKELMSKFEPK